jgi:hypothetical protein
MFRRGGVLDTQRCDQLPDRVRRDGHGPRSRRWRGGIGRPIWHRPRYLRHLLPQRKEVRGQRQSPWRSRVRRRPPRGSHQRGDGRHRSTKTRPSRRTDARPSRCRWRWRRRRPPQRRHGQAVEPAAGADRAGFARNRHPWGADGAGSLSPGSGSTRSRPSGSRSARGSDTGTRRRPAGRCATGRRSADDAAATRHRPLGTPAAAKRAPSLADPAATSRPSTGAHRRSRPRRDTGDIPRRVRRLPQSGDRRRPCTCCAVRHRGDFGDHRARGAGRVPAGSRRAGIAAREHHERCPIPAMTVVPSARYRRLRSSAVSAPDVAASRTLTLLLRKPEWRNW